MKCPNCSTEIDVNSKFCGVCGTSLTSTTNIVVQEQQANTQQIQTEGVIPATTISPSLETNTINTTPIPPVATITQPGLNNNPNRKSKKVVFVAIGTIIIVLITIAAFILFSLNSEQAAKKEAINDKFDPEKLIKVKKNDKYVYIDSKGKIVLDSNYTYASDFHGDYAIVETEIEADGSKRPVYQAIDKKGKVKVQGESEIEYLKEYDLWIVDEILYNSSMKQISPANTRVKDASEGFLVWVNSKKNTGGIMNSKGKITYTYNFSQGESYISIDPSSVEESLKENYCCVNIENEKYAVVNCNNGKVVHDFTNKYISAKRNNIFTIHKDDSYKDETVIYYQDNKEVYKTDDPENINITYYPGYLSIYDEGKSYSEGRYSYLDLDTMEIKSSPPAGSANQDEDLDEWEKYTGYKELYQNGKYGLSNDTKIILPPTWESIRHLDVDLYKYLKSKNKDYILAQNEQKWHLVSLKDNKSVQEFNTSYINTDDDSTFIYYTDQNTNNKKVYNLLSGKSLNISSNTYFTIYSNYITIKDSSSKMLKYYNTNLELIYTENL